MKKTLSVLATLTVLVLIAVLALCSEPLQAPAPAKPSVRSASASISADENAKALARLKTDFAAIKAGKSEGIKPNMYSAFCMGLVRLNLYDKVLSQYTANSSFKDDNFFKEVEDEFERSGQDIAMHGYERMRRGEALTCHFGTTGTELENFEVTVVQIGMHKPIPEGKHDPHVVEEARQKLTEKAVSTSK